MQVKVKTTEEAKEIVYQKLSNNINDDTNPPLIMDNLTIEFDWGYLFRYNSKKWIETKNEDYVYFAAPPVLVDKHDGTAHYIKTVNTIFDSELEKYREEKGYQIVIKFPIKEKISGLTPLEQVKILFRTGELIQIRKGIKILKEKQLIELDEFQKIIFNNAFPNWNFEEQIASQFNHESISLNKRIGNSFPKDFKIFKESTSLNFSGVKLNRIDESILQLENLTQIEIWFSEISKISPDILKLEFIESISIWDSILGKQAEEIIDKFGLNKSIEINYYGKNNTKI